MEQTYTKDFQVHSFSDFGDCVYSNFWRTELLQGSTDAGNREPIEDIHSGKTGEQATNEVLDVQDLCCLPEDQTEDLSESQKNAASDSPKESITPEQGELYYQYR